jgi:hypothetical protein
LVIFKDLPQANLSDYKKIYAKKSYWNTCSVGGSLNVADVSIPKSYINGYVHGFYLRFFVPKKESKVNRAFVLVVIVL